jgi:dihydropteroate synthase
VVAAAAIGTWLGMPVIRSRHTRAARRAIDMTLVIAGTRPPARTLRGLA